MRHLSIVVTLLVIAATGLAHARADAPPTVVVSVSKGSCRLSRALVPAGDVRFRLVNGARLRATFSIRRLSARVEPRRARTVTWSLTAGDLPYRCLLGRAVVGRGRLTVTAPPPPPGPSIAISGEPQTVFDWTTDRCDDEDIPDFPTRVFRDGHGRLQLIASHHAARRMVGPSLDELTRNCRVVLTSHRNERPEAFDDSEWIAAPYTLDGETVHALVHNEYHGQDHGSAYCPSGNNGSCWYDAITLATSTDGGATYTHSAPPSHVVAAPPWRYVPDLAGLGYYGGTNIVRNPADGYFYAMIGRAAPGLSGGACVIRTDALDQPRSWRFWNGQHFAGLFVDPYATEIDDPASHACPPVLDVLAESLTWNTYLERWLLIGSKAFSRTTGGFFFATSTDLVHWTAPRSFHRVELTFTYVCGEEDPKAYASFVDPASRERNFDVTGRTGWLYYTRFHYLNCQMNLDRDLERVPIEISR